VPQNWSLDQIQKTNSIKYAPSEQLVTVTSPHPVPQTASFEV